MDCKKRRKIEKNSTDIRTSTDTQLNKQNAKSLQKTLVPFDNSWIVSPRKKWNPKHKKESF